MVSGIPARIPSRLGEPGSLFSRYKFLQLRLVVVMLLTRTRRELLKRRTIGAHVHVYPTASLSRASRATFFVTAADPRYIPDDESFLFPVQLRLLTPIRSPIPFESFGPGASPKGCPMFVRSAFRPQIPFSGLISLHCVLYIVTFILCTV